MFGESMFKSLLIAIRHAAACKVAKSVGVLTACNGRGSLEHIANFERSNAAAEIFGALKSAVVDVYTKMTKNKFFIATTDTRGNFKIFLKLDGAA